MHWKGLKHYSRRVWDRIDYGLLPLCGIVVRERKTTQYVGEAIAIGEDGQKIAVALERWMRPAPPAGAIYVSPLGMVFKGGRILADYSTIGPNLFETRSAIWSRLRHRGKIPVLERGTVFGMAHPQTYGDWFKHGLLTLCSSEPQPPVLVPRRFLWDREYVRRDLNRLGVAVHVVGDAGAIIEHPTLLAPTSPFPHWLPGEIGKVRFGMHVVPVSARPGSLLYLSREGEVAGSIDRRYLSLCIEQLTRELGGRVVRTKNTRFDEYLDMGGDAETVIADHGAAQCNLTWWKTKRVIEIQSTHKSLFFVTLGASAGIEEYMIVDSVGKSEKQLQAVVGQAVKGELARVSA